MYDWLTLAAFTYLHIKDIFLKQIVSMKIKFFHYILLLLYFGKYRPAGCMVLTVENVKSLDRDNVSTV